MLLTSYITSPFSASGLGLHTPAFWNTKMTSYSGQQYLRQLLYKATEYINRSYQSGFDEVEFFYRCKSDDYFREVKRNNNVMEPIMKDFNGDPKSPINGKLKGVFLGVDLRSGSLPEASPFGGTRVAFPIEAIFTERTNLYFTDFYCTVSHYHYITLVLTTAGSAADDFCNSHLLKLNPFNNPFLLRTGNRFKVVEANCLHVEVFYTENVDLDYLTARFGSNMVFFKRIRILGKGSSTWGGLRKDSYCSTCNPSSPTQTISSSIENCLSPQWSSAKEVYSSQNVSDPILRVRSHAELSKPIFQTRPQKLPSVCESLPKPKDPSPWWHWKKWQIGVLGALICIGLYLSIM